MFKVEQFLLIKKKGVALDCFHIEDCGDTEAELSDFEVILPKEKLPELLSFVETETQNPTYVYNLLNKNTVKGMSLLANMLKISSYTCEFIKAYGGVQEILDLFKPADNSKPAEDTEKDTAQFFDFQHFSVTDSVDASDTVEPSNTTPEVETDNIADIDSASEVKSTMPDVKDEESSTNSQNDADLEENAATVKTEEISENSHNYVDESEARNQLMIPQEMSDMMLMLRAMAVKMGVLENDTSEVMNLEDVQNAKLYLNELAATTVRDGVIAVLDKASSREELEAVTTFMAMFISYMKEV